MKFNAEDATFKTISWIKNWFFKNGKDCNAVIGISGGKDSSIVAALLAEALGKDRIIGVIMPNGSNKDIDMALLLIRHLDIQYYIIDIKEAYDSLIKKMQNSLGDISDNSKINLAPRLRMSTLYGVAQSRNGRVANTCNYSEDYVGYSTRYGDSAGDFSPISSFTTKEVREIGHYLKLPNELVEKAPDDGISGMSDEEKLGFSYATLDKYIRTGIIDDMSVKKKIDDLHEKNLFKLRYMDSFKYFDD